MSEHTASAAGGAMPAEGHKTRRPALRLILSSAAILPMMMPASSDAELLAMEAEIKRLRGLAKAINDEKVEPFEAAFIALLKVNCKAGWAFAAKYGRDAAIGEAEKFSVPADRLCERLMTTPTLTEAGRAAKVRVLLSDILGDGCRGPEQDLDWDIAQARALFGEFAGMSAEEIANV